MGLQVVRFTYCGDPGIFQDFQVDTGVYHPGDVLFDLSTYAL